MSAKVLYVEGFPDELRRAGKIAALMEGITWREFVIRAVQDSVKQAQSGDGTGRAVPARDPSPGP